MDWLTRNVDQVWHEWFNREKDFDSSRYEFKSMLFELRRLPYLFKAQREGKLPQIHKQCSLSPSEPIKNELTCCMVIKVVECKILKDLTEYFAGRRKHYTEITDDQLDGVKAATCCWHILSESDMGRNHKFDTSEGYILTTSDRMYWDRVYEDLAKG